MITHSIKTDGSGDFTSLQAWETAVDGLSADTYVADCYEGGDLGGVTISSVTSGSTLVIQAAAGNGHNGSLTDGAYIGGTGSVVIQDTSSVQVLGLRFKRESTGPSSAIATSISTASVSGLVIDSCLIELITAAGQNMSGVSIGVSGDGLSVSARVSNNIVVNAGASTSAVNYAFNFSSVQFASSPTPTTATILAYNNVAVGNSKSAGGFRLARTQVIGTGSANLNVTLRNNVSFGGTTAYSIVQTGNGIASIISSNNASSDSTADVFGGTGHIEGFTPAAEFSDPAADWSLLEESQFIEAGFDLSGTFTNDAFGNTRSAPFSIGAWEGTFAPPPSPSSEPLGTRTRGRTRLV